MAHTIICISSYYKGSDFMRACKALGNTVYLITSESLRSESWPWESIDEVFYMEEIKPFKWNLDHLVLGISHLMKSVKVDRVVALDDFDVEKAAFIRENFRIPGMGQTTQRYFRDKLAMRKKALDEQILVPQFTAIFNDDDVNFYADQVSPPWVLKPRSEASASGIIKIHSKEELWQKIDSLGEERHKFLLEQFRPGKVFHVDTLVCNGKVVFTSSSRYLDPPMAVSHEGGVFRTMTLNPKSEDGMELKRLNNILLKKFGLFYGASHSEFIKDNETGEWYFLETSARVGGAYIADMVEASTGISLWKEWAIIENKILANESYQLPINTYKAAGLLVSLAKEKHPDTSIFTDVEIVKRLQKEYHVGFVFSAEDEEIIQDKLDQFATIVTEKFLNIIPPTDTPTN
ncbi:ATPase [Ascidiimonas sp. W6]|uniref:ATP-grasp domain-containing protein n=1 Tax=Ascidiimonas meishanensis TaxID=3128903 RepID=UPI0030ECA3E0